MVETNREILEENKARLAAMMFKRAYPALDWEEFKDDQVAQFYWGLADEIIYSDWAANTRQYWVQMGRDEAVNEFREALHKIAGGRIETGPILKPTDD